jgi:hypothetical protein
VVVYIQSKKERGKEVKIKKGERRKMVEGTNEEICKFVGIM